MPAALGRLLERASAQGGAVRAALAELVDRTSRAGGGIPSTKTVAPIVARSMLIKSLGVLGASRSIARLTLSL